ncbi:MAG: 1-acyl-sn-glycerol-3-phosphate acyltransferase [Clostridiales bacterium]|nr:1-acyl-sn-glycerol-3-phosphate acyltransferase [Candidatus Apopatousia equi]
MFYWISLILLYLPTRILFPTRIKGKKNLPKGKAIYACNHQTNFDSIIIGTGFFRRLYALGKAELFKNKFFGFILKKLGCIKIERGKADIEAVKQTLTILKKKEKPMLIFPTGTRNSTPDELNEIKNGVAMFSVKSNSPIIPMVMIKKPIIFRPNKLIVGKPLDLSKYEGRVAGKELYDEISNDLTIALETLLKENMKVKIKK